MDIKYKDIVIRNAVVSDSDTICSWWNDGEVMAHAGFPLGFGTTVEKVESEILACNDMDRLCLIEHEGSPIGEMNYRIGVDRHTAEIGIKICVATKQNRGLGRIILSLFISELFSSYGVTKITLDPNLKNVRAQHVYESLGCRKVGIEYDSWKDQMGELQSAVLYELVPDDFISYIE